MTPRPSYGAGPVTGPRQHTIWIFGYGSLCWKPDFEYMNKSIGYVKGYTRRFWQGNTAHRGTPDKPGRVATLVEDKEDDVWGVGYQVMKNSPVLDYLWERECVLGGYHLIQVKFYPVFGEPVKGLAYIATPSSPGWLGYAPLSEMAINIAETEGPAGPNSEYICKLASWVRSNSPIKDNHLSLLDNLVRIAEMFLSNKSLAEKIIKEIIKNYEFSEDILKPYDYPTERFDTFKPPYFYKSF